MLTSSQLCSTSGRSAVHAVASPAQRCWPSALSSPTSHLPVGLPVLRHSVHRRHLAGLPTCSVCVAGSPPLPEQQPEQQQHPQEVGSTFTAQQVHPAVALASAILQLLVAAIGRARDAFTAVLPQVDRSNAQGMLQQIRGVTRSARLMLTVVLPLARATSSESLTAVYARTFERAAFGFAKMYVFCLFLRVLLSWFPEIDWNSQPWAFLRLITEPYLNIYRGILPPLFGQLDFTPLFGFLILQDVVEVMSPTYTLGLHAAEDSEMWTTSDVLAYFNGF